MLPSGLVKSCGIILGVDQRENTRLYGRVIVRRMHVLRTDRSFSAASRVIASRLRRMGLCGIPHRSGLSRRAGQVSSAAQRSRNRRVSCRTRQQCLRRRRRAQ